MEWRCVLIRFDLNSTIVQPIMDERKHLLAAFRRQLDMRLLTLHLFRSHSFGMNFLYLTKQTLIPVDVSSLRMYELQYEVMKFYLNSMTLPNGSFCFLFRRVDIHREKKLILLGPGHSLSRRPVSRRQQFS